MDEFAKLRKKAPSREEMVRIICDTEPLTKGIDPSDLLQASDDGADRAVIIDAEGNAIGRVFEANIRARTYIQYQTMPPSSLVSRSRPFDNVQMIAGIFAHVVFKYRPEDTVPERFKRWFLEFPWVSIGFDPEDFEEISKEIVPKIALIDDGWVVSFRTG